MDGRQVAAGPLTHPSQGKGEASSSRQSTRDEHLFGSGRKRILSLDGGGVRGAFALAFLQRMERLLSEKAGRAVRLGEVFDLIGGTSTGAIIACGLAMGFSVETLREFYIQLAPKVFARRFWRIVGLRAKFDARSLRRELDQILGDRPLDTDDLVTGLAVVMKRMDTGSPWIVSNNPRSVFWDSPSDPSAANRHLKLASLVRASTAAPHYFDPELIQLFSRGDTGLFIDGGITPYNNPALALFLMATLPQYRISWQLGPDHLTIVSLGTGRFRQFLSARSAARSGPIGLAVHALRSLIIDGEVLTGGLMQALGSTETPWTVNSEVGSMTGLPIPGGPLFRYLRYDLELERGWLLSELGRDIDEDLVRRLTLLDDPAMVHLAYELGSLAAEKQVQPSHLAGWI